MDRDKIIKTILGDRYEEGKEIAEIVLNFVDKNPEWNSGRCANRLYKNIVLVALDKAVQEIYGHALQYYYGDSRKRECVDVRQMAMYIYHKETGFSLNEVGEIFGKHHSTVIFAYKNVEKLRSIDKVYSRDFDLLEETTKKYL